MTTTTNPTAPSFDITFDWSAPAPQRVHGAVAVVLVQGPRVQARLVLADTVDGPQVVFSRFDSGFSCRINAVEYTSGTGSWLDTQVGRSWPERTTPAAQRTWRLLVDAVLEAYETQMADLVQAELLASRRRGAVRAAAQEALEGATVNVARLLAELDIAAGQLEAAVRALAATS